MVTQLSLFLPTYNEEGVIRKTVLNSKKVITKYFNKWEIIIVNDASKDNTKAIVDDLSKNDSKIRVVNHSVNKGYGGAFKTGLYSSKYDWIALIDSDGQFDFSEINNFVKKQNETGADLVIGYYKKRQVSKLKILTSKMWEFAVYVLFGLHVKDIDCGFKLISKKVIDTIPKLESERGAFISSELLIKSRKAGFKIVEIPVTHLPRVTGKGTGRDIKVIIQSFVDLFRLWKKLR